MGAIGYYLTLPFIYVISLLPFRLMYILSDFLYIVLYKWIGYRKVVVRNNLVNSFPEKTEKEILKIEKDFYRYFFYLSLEALKTLTISPENVKDRVNFDDNSIFRKFYEKNQSVIIVMGHFGNWELSGARFSLDSIHQLYVIYHPLNNEYFDGLMYKMRTRLGNKLYTMNGAYRGMVKNKNNVTATAFIADQTPSPIGAYWTTFLNQDTPVFVGTAKIARKLDYPIIYITATRVKRGYYKLTSELLIEHPASLTENEISELHTKKLEKDIRENPEIWLWTHRRWKHKRESTDS